MKHSCVNYEKINNSCKILSCLQCDLKNKCTFHETVQERYYRIKKINPKIHIYETRLKKISELNNWDSVDFQDEWNDLFKLTDKEKEEYLSRWEKTLNIKTEE